MLARLLTPSLISSISPQASVMLTFYGSISALVSLSIDIVISSFSLRIKKTLTCANPGAVGIPL